MMAAIKRIENLESSILFLENRNTELMNKFEESLRLSENLSKRLNELGKI